jgi:hypothetical protein
MFDTSYAMPTDGRHWIYKVMRLAASAGFTIEVRRADRVVCCECRCPIPVGHIAFQRLTLWVCFECLVQGESPVLPLPDDPAPASLDPFWDRGEN